MDADILAASSSIDLQRIQAQDYRDAAEAAAASRAAEIEAANADRAAAAEWRRTNLALSERQIAAVERQEARLATPDQERWLELYRMHLAIRLGPAIITSTTPSTVIVDLVNDAVDMTVTTWPRVKAELAKLPGTSAPVA